MVLATQNCFPFLPSPQSGQEHFRPGELGDHTLTQVYGNTQTQARTVSDSQCRMNTYWRTNDCGVLPNDVLP